MGVQLGLRNWIRRNMLMGEDKRINYFVAGGTGANTQAISLDGKIWTANGTKMFGTNGQDIAYNGTIFVAVGNGENTLAWSNDGENWIGLGTSIFSTTGFGVCWNGSIFVATGQGTNTLAWSNDGKIWTGLGTTIFNSNGQDIAWNGSIFVATGQSNNTLAWSNDGKTWTGLGTTIFNYYGLGVCWGNNQFVSFGQGDNNSIATSPDGKIWTGRGKTIFTDWGYAGVWTGQRYVAVGRGTNTIAHSIDGITWTGLGTTIFTSYGQDIAWNGTILVAAGRGGNSIAYSENGGLNWTGLGTSIFSSWGNGIVSAKAPQIIPSIRGRKETVINTPIYRIIGDSIALYSSAATNAQGWTSLLCKDKQVFQYNHSVNGAPLQNHDPFLHWNVRDEIENLLPIKTINDSYLFLPVGTNDCYVASYTPTAFDTQFREVINICIQKGYSVSNIIIPTLYYFTNYGGGSLAKLLELNTIVQDLWNDFGLLIQPDVYTYMENNGGASLLAADGLHSNTNGHLQIFNYYKSIM